jgi:cell division GTPase FtsZ
LKVTVIGFGKCGVRIAEEFARANIKTRVERGFGITAGVFAVDSTPVDMALLKRIRPERRIVIGGEKTAASGTNREYQLGLDIANEAVDKIVENIGKAEKFLESDAFFLFAGTGGGTGSAAIGLFTQKLRERYPEKAAYTIVLTPFEDEEKADEKVAVNTGRCLRACYAAANAVFVLDNQRFTSKNWNITDNAFEINTEIVGLFFELLAAGEEKNHRYIGAKTVDAGDIMASLTGWTVIGQGKVPVKQLAIPLVNVPITIKLPAKIPFLKKNAHFLDRFSEGTRGPQIFDEAMNNLSVKVNPADAMRAFFIVAAPAEDMEMDMMVSLGNNLRKLAPEATMRNGDYPRPRDSMSITIILSELTDPGKVVNYLRLAK